MKSAIRGAAILALQQLSIYWTVTTALHIPKELNVSSNVSCSGTAYECLCGDIKPPASPATYQLSVSLYIPDDQIQKASNGGWPLIVFFHGFGGKYLLHTGDYKPYRVAATNANYAFLEYDINKGAGISETTTDTIEVGFLDGLISWVANITQSSSSPAYGKIDLKRIAAVGHSRGGKLAALHFAAGKHPIFAAYLADPVDCPCFAPCNESTTTCFPSALEALKKVGKPVGLSGALVKGCCNPIAGNCGDLCSGICLAASHNCTCTGHDYRDFLGALPGSLNFTANAGHMQFADPSVLVRLGGNLLCNGNWFTTSYRVSAEAAQHMVDWIDSRLPLAKGMTSVA